MRSNKMISLWKKILDKNYQYYQYLNLKCHIVTYIFWYDIEFCIVHFLCLQNTSLIYSRIKLNIINFKILRFLYKVNIENNNEVTARW